MGAGVPVVLRQTTRAARGESMTLVTHLDNHRDTRAGDKFPTRFSAGRSPGAPNPRVGMGCPPESAIIVGARGAEEDPIVAPVGIGLEEAAVVAQERRRSAATPAHGEVVGAVGCSSSPMYTRNRPVELPGSSPLGQCAPESLGKPADG